MTSLVPLVVTVPLLAAALVAAAGHFAPRRADHVLALAIALAVTVMCVLLIFDSSDETIHYWFGGWHPRNGIALGISFSVDPLSAAIAALIGALAVAALIVSWDYFDEEVPQYFFALVLVFVAGMVGFVLSSDLFNLFVFFELMSVPAFALTGYRIEQPSVLHGAINFAVVNSVGAFMLMTGIALLYGRTGALNLAQIGQVLSRKPADGLVIVAFTLVCAGFLTKAGAFPFHFWLSDAYAVAPAPVCILFAGVMSDLGLHAVARTYWEAFSGALGGSDEAVRAVFVAVGVITALLGGVMAFVQSSLKRMLAFIVVSHVGVFLTAIGLLTASGLAGATRYLVADGLAKGAAFCAVAHIARRTGTVDELHARGRGRALPVTGVVLALCALAFAAVPPLGTSLSHALVTDAARDAGYGWLPPVLVVATGLTGAAVLRAAARIFLGLGGERDALLVEPVEGEEREVRPTTGLTSALFAVPAAALVIAALGLAFAPAIADEALIYAARVADRAGAARETLHGVRPSHDFASDYDPSRLSWVYTAASTLLAVALAGVALYRRRLPELLRLSARRLEGFHDGVTGDYVTWAVAGTAILGALFAISIR
jgi:multicomponent Na+:H+ antiporter subunit D